MQLALFNSMRPRVMVVSHERSGTHFLMNSLHLCYGYSVDPFLNFDHIPVNINYYSPPHIAAYLGQFGSKALASIVKAHHPFDFFAEVIEQVAGAFVVFYIVRDPRDVMVSFQRFLNHWPWHEGPKTATCAAFIRAAPSGQMLRYQYVQHETVLHRWRHHVDGWTTRVPEALRHRVVLVRYEDLHRDFETTVRSFSGVLERAPAALRRPAPGQGVVLPSKGAIGSHRDHFSDDDLVWTESVAGDTMRRLGYA